MRLLCLLSIFPIATAVCAPVIHSELDASLKPQMPLEKGWENPPHLARTRVWWWWLNGNTDKETITRDLEAMKANGIGGANIIDAGGDNQQGNNRVKHGPDFGSAEWLALFHHAVKEADRLELELGFNIQSGWNLGGPQVTVEESSKMATFSLTAAEGGRTLSVKLAEPESKLGFYQDFAVVAWPANHRGAMLADLDQKAYFKYPGQFTATEAWHLLDAGPEQPGDAVCQPGDVVDLTKHMDTGGSQLKTGKGRVIWGATTWEVFASEGTSPDFTWRGRDQDTLLDFIHRRTDDTHIYYVCNRNDRPEKVELCFRVSGLLPEFWDPVTGSRRDATDYRIENGVTVIPYPLNGEESLFVLFRKPTVKSSGKPNVPELAEIAGIDGPWAVSFDPQWGGPALVVFDELTDWTQNAEEAIRHYSGSAVYDKTFTAPAAGGRVFLDLGGVESLCEVTLNGEDLGVLWSAPFRVEVTGKLKRGNNRLQVKVVNLWANRIIGDAALPPEKRQTRTNITALKKDTPLEPSGLLGPVRLLVPTP